MYASVWNEINRGRNFCRKHNVMTLDTSFATQVEFSSILQVNLCVRRMA